MVAGGGPHRQESGAEARDRPGAEAPKSRGNGTRGGTPTRELGGADTRGSSASPRHVLWKISHPSMNGRRVLPRSALSRAFSRTASTRPSRSSRACTPDLVA